MRPTRDGAERVRLLGQMDLGAAASVLTGVQLWSIQEQIAAAVSTYRARVAVPSCNASGKTHLAALLALAFYNSYTPGTPCHQCDPTGTKGGCRGAKVITTSSKEAHLRDNLWGEIRRQYPKIAERGLPFPGRLYEGDLRLAGDDPNHFIVGQSAASAEGMQGFHAAHKLIIGDEATSVDDEVKLAITRLLASADSRLLLIYNPTTPDTYAATMARSPEFTTIRITAYDTPAFTGEPMPEGANLITPEFLRELEAQGMGEGTFEWVTSIEARDWDVGEDVLVPVVWYDRQRRAPELGQGKRQIGVDISSYGADECVIAVRDGDQLVDLRAFPSMKVADYVRGPVTKAVMDWQPQAVVFDGDGVGAGAVGYFEDLQKLLPPGGQVVTFRGGRGHPGRYLNQRSYWYWVLRQRFESGEITVGVQDDKLRAQLTDIHYAITATGDIRIESKGEMRKRGMSSPDRADAMMYAFAFADVLVSRAVAAETRVADLFGLTDHSMEAMWRRTLAARQPRLPANAVLGVPDEF